MRDAGSFDFGINPDGDDPIVYFTRTDGESVRLTPTATLGAGGYGRVVRYNSDEAGAPDYAMKIEQGDVADSEHGVIQALSDTRCGQIGARVVGTLRPPGGDQHYSLLEEMTSEVFPELVPIYRAAKGLGSNALAAAHIVEEVRKQVVCLLNSRADHRYVYTDMKMANVMFRRDPGTGDVTIKVGDLGSMTPDEDGDYVLSIPCLPDGGAWQSFATLADKQQCLAFQLGMLLAALLGLNIAQFWHSRTRPGQSTVPFQALLRAALRANGAGSSLDELVGLIDDDPNARPSVLAPLVGGGPAARGRGRGRRRR